MPETSLPDADAVDARPRRRVRRTLIVIGIVAAVAIAATGTVFAVEAGRNDTRASEAHTARFSAGATIPAALAAPVPADALYVAAGAAPGGDGTIGRPLATVKAALDRVRDSATIVLRGGEYHESVFIGASKRVEVRAAPGEQVVFDGSSPLTEWQQDGEHWSTSWTAEFDSSPSYTRGEGDGQEENWKFLDPAYPMAAHPEQVWVDGERLRQVKDPADVDDSSFAIDTEARRLVIGVDPASREVRASTLQLAFTVRSASSILNGITVRRYAPSIPDMGAIVLEGDGVTLVDVAVEQSATIGVFVTGTGTTLQRVTIRDAGLIGATANFADHLTLDNVLLVGNNSERFNQAPVSGGFKISRSQHLTIRDSVVRDNAGHGIWVDQSVLDTVIVSTDVLDNAGHGVFAEISQGVLVADTVIAGNKRMGVKINDTGGVTIWRSTIVGNGLAVAILQDTRRASDPETPGHDERQPFPDPQMSWVIDSVVIGNSVIGDSLGSERDGAGGAGDGFVWAQDFSKEFTAEQMGVELQGNLFFRTVDGYPPQSIVWQLKTGGVDYYSSLDRFQQAVPGAAANAELDGLILDERYRLSAEAEPAAADLAQQAPDAVAALLGDIAPGIGAVPADDPVEAQAGSG